MSLLGGMAPAQASEQLFLQLCSGCHNDVAHPRLLVYNAAGNVDIITTVISLGMGALGGPAEHASIAAYLDASKPAIVLEPVAHDSPGTVITLADIIVSGATVNANMKIIERIETVTPPTKGTVAYQTRNGFGIPSYVVYTPFPGQSGTDSWTYRGVGSRGNTTVRTASVNIAAGATVPAANYQGMWAVPALAEAGWGINFTHQGDLIFASWFTYDADGKPWWVTMTAQRQTDGSFAGAIDLTAGPAFSAVPFDPKLVTHTTVGSGRLTFGDANNATFTYTLNGVTQTKTLARFQFATPVPVCTFNSTLTPAQATNYQDMWAVPNLAEAGWGINFTHQGDLIFASWFTYDAGGKPLWVTATLAKTGARTFSGPLDVTTGPPFNAVPFDPSRVAHSNAGTATATFTDGANGTFAYTLYGIAQTKAITRFVFSGAGTVCQ